MSIYFTPIIMGQIIQNLDTFYFDVYFVNFPKILCMLFSFLFFFIFFIFEFIFVRKSGAAHPTPTPMVRVCYTYKFFSIDNNRKSIYKYGFFSPPSSVSTNCSGVDRKPSWLCEYALNLIMCVKIRDMYVRQSLS